MRSKLIDLLRAALLSWVVMMAAGLIAGLLIETQLGHLRSGNADEFVSAFLIALTTPFALAIAAVYAPVALIVQRVRSSSPARVGAACAAAAPVAGALLFAIGVALWGWPRSHDLWFPLGSPGLALVVGGFLFGSSFTRMTAHD